MSDDPAPAYIELTPNPPDAGRVGYTDTSSPPPAAPHETNGEVTTYTVTGKRDGFGAQYQAVMSGIAYCMHKKYKYIHTPFKRVAHGGISEALNRFIGIPSGLDDNLIINKKERFSHDVHYHSRPSKYYTPDVLKVIRNYYYSTPKPNVNNIEIALHIRRGDVSKKDRGRFTDNETYEKIIAFLLQKYPDFKITIFSEGKVEDFNELKNDRVVFDLNSSIEGTFHSFVTAQVLIAAKSSFSYSGALLNKNIVYYQDFWHKPLDHWKIINTLDLPHEIHRYNTERSLTS